MAKRQTGRVTAIVGVSIVALTAAVISFTHVQHLAIEAGEGRIAAFLLPLSIDGAIAAAAAVILAESKSGKKQVLAWLMLTLGLVASLAANIMAAQPTWTARAIAAWPPIALALGVEVLAGMRRNAQRGAARVDREAEQAVGPDRAQAGPARVDREAEQAVGPDRAQAGPARVDREAEQAVGPDRAQAGPARVDREAEQAVGPDRAQAGPARVDREAEQAVGPDRAQAGPARVDREAEQAVGPDRAQATVSAVSSGGPVQKVGTPATARTAPSGADAADMKRILKLDAEAGREVSRRAVQDELGCGAYRADRLMKAARETSAVSDEEAAIVQAA